MVLLEKSYAFNHNLFLPDPCNISSVDVCVQSMMDNINCGVPLVVKPHFFLFKVVRYPIDTEIQTYIIHVHKRGQKVLKLVKMKEQTVFTFIYFSNDT